jgi:hypothetical protein
MMNDELIHHSSFIIKTFKINHLAHEYCYVLLRKH